MARWSRFLAACGGRLTRYAGDPGEAGTGKLGPGSWELGRGPVVTVHGPRSTVHPAHGSGACAFGARDTAHGRAALTGYHKGHLTSSAHKKARTHGGLCVRRYPAISGGHNTEERAPLGRSPSRTPPGRGPAWRRKRPPLAGLWHRPRTQ